MAGFQAVLSELDAQVGQLKRDVAGKADSSTVEAVSKTVTTEVGKVVKLVGELEALVQDADAETQAKAACHKEGQFYDPDAKECTLAISVSCGDTTPTTDERPSTYCAGSHFFEDECISKCAAGFEASPVSYVCGLDGKWSVKAGEDATAACVDVDECKDDNAGCEQGCKNSAGAYRCTCNNGYVLKSDGTTCVGFSDGSTVRFGHDTTTNTVEWEVPVGATTINVELHGAGGEENGGAGALVTATLKVEAGMKLVMVVGGAGLGLGLSTTTFVSPATYPHRKGGGLVGIFTGSPQSGGTPLVIAGSGGGGGANCASAGGAGGGDEGEKGTSKEFCPNDYKYRGDGVTYKGTETVQRCNGRGGTQKEGGKPGIFIEGEKAFGQFATQGERYKSGGHGAYGSDGGAGYFGGGGGAHCPNMSGGSGGGGSSYASPDASNVKMVRGGGAGAGRDGVITIIYS